MDPVTGVEKLTRFQDHFDNMFVTVIFGAFAGIPVQEEDIHFVLSLLHTPELFSIRFYYFVGAGAGAGGGGAGGGGNTISLNRASALSFGRPRYTISNFSFNRSARRGIR